MYPRLPLMRFEGHNVDPRAAADGEAGMTQADVTQCGSFAGAVEPLALNNRTDWTWGQVSSHSPAFL